TLAAVIFAGSLALNAYLLLAWGLAHNTGYLRTTTLLEGDPSTKIALIPIDGIITDASAKKFNRVLEQVQDDPDVRALIIRLDTPGGTVTASDDIHHMIEQYKASTHNKVIIEMKSLTASGGYYISVAGDYLMAEPTTMTGSIGVLMPQIDLTQLGDKYGIHDDSIHSTGADFKEVGSPLKPETPEQRQYLLDLIDQAFARFKALVVSGRQHATNPLHGDINSIANGKVYTAAEAFSLGLIDNDNGYPEDVYQQAAKMASVSKPTVVEYQMQETLLEMLSAQSPVKPIQSVTGVNLNINSDVIQDLLSPRLMYLWHN
ncbi:MAG TPA: signal peptide peptidase SppA, partial [Tepidisphaeraceae bacterium]|nr:signal peptide peptidase SppA [Tepidisphaeraceae bacterium]